MTQFGSRVARLTVLIRHVFFLKIGYWPLSDTAFTEWSLLNFQVAPFASDLFARI